MGDNTLVLGVVESEVAGSEPVAETGSEVAEVAEIAPVSAALSSNHRYLVQDIDH